MTISVPNQLVYSSDGDGATSQFSYPVRILEAGELVVLRRENDVDTTLTLNTDYTLSGIGDAGGVTITMLSVPIAGQKIVRYRATAPKQIVDLKDKQANPAEAVEQQLDRMAMVGQDHDQRISEYEDRIDDLDTSVAAAAASATAAATSETNAASSDTSAEAAADRAEAAAASIDYLTVADRTALKAVDTGAHTVAYLRESGREGQFVWNSSDLSTLVAADTQEGIYVAPNSDPTGASGAWVRDFSGPVSVRWFGAKADGATDDRSAVQGATAISHNVYFPGGTYYLSASIGFGAGSKNVRFSGDGKGITFLKCATNGIAIDLAGFSPFNAVTIEGMTLITTGTIGTAISITNTAASVESNISIRRVEIASPSVHLVPQTQYWEKGISLSGVRFAKLDDVTVWGGGMTLSSIGWEITSEVDDLEFGFSWNKLWITGFANGIKATGGLEGIYGSSGEIWNCRYPVLIDRTGVATSECTTRISDMHINGSSVVFKATNTTNIGLNNCQLINGIFDDSGTNQSANIVECIGGQRFILSNCLVESRQSSDDSLTLIGVRLEDCIDVQITDNIIDGVTTYGVRILGSSTTRVKVKGNIIRGASAAAPLDRGVSSAVDAVMDIEDNQYTFVTTEEDVGDLTLVSLTHGSRSFTPQIQGAVTAGAGTYSAQEGTYSRTKRRIDFSAVCTTTAHTGTGGIRLVLTGMPTAAQRGTVSVYVSTLTFSGFLCGRIMPGTNFVSLQSATSDAVSLPVNIDGSCEISVSGSYFI